MELPDPDLLLKRSRDWYGLKLLRQHMFLASKRLASYRKMDKGVGIGDGSGPTEPLPIFFAYMTAIVPRVNVLKNNASFV
jgi:hypothetical protein